MFYQGDLQSGINKAVQESKSVACFVADNGAESQLWEREFLGDPTIKNLVADQTVLLRLGANSQEAAYLGQIYPVPKIPTLVVIRDGKLEEYIPAGTPKDAFLRRIRLILQPGGHSASISPAPANTAENNAPAPLTARQPSLSQPNRNPSTTTQTYDDTSSVESQQSVEPPPVEAAAPTETKKKEQKGTENGKKTPQSKAEEDASEESNFPSSRKAKAADMKYALLQKKRQQEAKDERARVLKRVEADKMRRAREAQSKAEHAKSREQSVDNVSTTPDTSSRKSKSPPTQHSECALQIRLFDGSTIRSRFPSGASLKTEIRRWIAENQEFDTPYTFKQVLTPLPNKDISISEEEQSLQSLRLAPSATLILIRVGKYTPAYAGGGGVVGNSTGILSRVASKVYSLIASIVLLITAFFSSFFWGSPANSAQEAPPADGPAAAPSSRINVRTLRDQREGRDDQQFYNGNALNFEPRPDDEDRKDV